MLDHTAKHFGYKVKSVQKYCIAMKECISIFERLEGGNSSKYSCAQVLKNFCQAT